VLASSCLALLLAEGAVRLFAPNERDHVLPGRLFEIDEHLGWKLEANRQVRHRTRYFDVSYTTNASGFRDRTRDGSTLGAGYRVLLYGDSQVFGWGVAEESRFSSLLESSLPFLEVWNRAIPAYGFDQQILSYERSEAAPHADEVVFFVSAVTLDRSRHDVRYGKPKPMFVEDGNGGLRVVPPRSVGVSRWLYRYLSPLYLPQFVNRRVERLRENLGQARESRGADRGTNAAQGGAGDFEKKLLILARDLAAGRRHRMTILAALPPEMTGDLRSFCGRQGIGFVAVDERLRLDQGFGRDDPHWTPGGHRLAAEQIRSQVDWEHDAAMVPIPAGDLAIRLGDGPGG
jgi:hypothetical protein